MAVIGFNVSNEFINAKTERLVVNECRKETFSKYPFDKFIKNCLDKKDAEIVIKGDEFYLFSTNYNWKYAKIILKQIISACDNTIDLNDLPKISHYELLEIVWYLLPQYLEKYEKFHVRSDGSCMSKLEIMHQIFANQTPTITEENIVQSTKLKDNSYLSLDTGFVSTINDGYVLGHLVSLSYIKIKYAAAVIQALVWPCTRFEQIVDTIRNNKGRRYYNITTDYFVNPSSVGKFTNVDDKFQIVADKTDTKLFEYIVGLFTNPHIYKLILLNNFFPDVNDVRTIQKKQINKNKSVPKKDVNKIIPKEEVVKTKHTKRRNGSSTKRKTIPLNVRNMTWREYNGNCMDGKCWCCGNNITIENWHAGHVIPASQGGPNSVDNLRPLCQGCNLSMSDVCMSDFIKEYRMKGRGAKEFA